ncbi:hypothetical protein C8Q80DRAFT_396807 [Daedaleopsis nitida]|nr:hypothetical protein C8Q80DRAFT_396807 [Daedaleopsis nitida]
MVEDPEQPPVPSEILLRIGPVLMGSLLSFMLFGISIVQLYIYHTSYPLDRRSLQITVYSIFALDIFQTIIAADAAWDMLCSGWGRSINLRFPDWSWYCLPIVSGVVAAWVQLFYAWRIHQLGKWKIIPIAVVLVALAQTGAACSIGISLGMLKDVERLHDPHMYARTIVWLGGGASVDVTIMSSMVYLLYSARRKTGVFKRGELMINRLLRLTIETNSACALCAILELAFFLGMRSTNLHFLFALVLSKVYSNTLMASLNSRNPKNGLAAQRMTLSTLSFSDLPAVGGLDGAPQLPPIQNTGEPNQSLDSRRSRALQIELVDTHGSVYSHSLPKGDYDRDHYDSSLDTALENGKPGR